MRTARIVLVMLFAGTVLTVTGCEQKGPAEQAGEKIDDAAERSADAVATVGASVKDAVD